MRVLVTSSRMPFALGLIRRFGEAGHEVFASDTFLNAPGSHSTYVSEYFLTAAPRDAPDDFVADLCRVVDEREIDLVIPAFEEAIVMASRIASFPSETVVYVGAYADLMRLHNKSEFRRLVADLGLRTPATTIVTDSAQLSAAIDRYPNYMARASYSRAGQGLLTNTGPRAGAMRVEDAQPTEEDPWLVQEFVVGTDLCTYGLARAGRVTGHLTYEHPVVVDDTTGIVFESVDVPETLDITERIVAATSYTGQIALDLLDADDGGGLYLIECNPRGTDGVLLTTADELVGGVLDNAEFPAPDVVPAGRRAKLGSAVALEMLGGWPEIKTHALDLLTAPDAYLRLGDMMPAVYQFLSYSQVLRYRRRRGSGMLPRKAELAAAMVYDISCDGEPIE